MCLANCCMGTYTGYEHARVNGLPSWRQILFFHVTEIRNIPMVLTELDLHKCFQNKHQCKREPAYIYTLLVSNCQLLAPESINRNKRTSIVE